MLCRMFWVSLALLGVLATYYTLSRSVCIDFMELQNFDHESFHTASPAWDLLPSSTSLSKGRVVHATLFMQLFATSPNPRMILPPRAACTHDAASGAAAVTIISSHAVIWLFRMTVMYICSSGILTLVFQPHTLLAQSCSSSFLHVGCN